MTSHQKTSFLFLNWFAILIAAFLCCTPCLIAQESDGASSIQTKLQKDDSEQSIRRLGQIDIFDLEFASDPQISPNGERVVYVRNSFDIMTDKRRARLWIVDAAGTNHRPLTDFDQFGSSPRWSPDGGRVAYVASDGDKSQVFCRWMDTGQTAKLTSLLESPTGLKWSPDGMKIAFSSFVPKQLAIDVKLPKQPNGAQWADPAKYIERLKYRADGKGYLREGHTHLFLVDASGGTAKQITSGDYDHSSDFSWSLDGTSIWFSANRTADADLEPNHKNLYSVNIESSETTVIVNRKGATQSPIELAGGEVIFSGNVDNLKGYQPSKIYKLKDGKEELVSREFDRSIASLKLNPESGAACFLYDEEGTTAIGEFSLDGEFRKIVSNVGGTTLGRPYSSGSFSIANDGTIAFTQCGTMSPASVAVLQNGASKPIQLTDLNRDLLGERDLGKVQEFWFSSSFDNQRIQSWIVTPPDFDEKKKYPMILEIHGGPFANYGPRFSAEMQLYAAAGYVVLYLNPRGSTSYGEEFGNLIHHNYPGNDFDDLMSGVDALIAKGYIDTNQLFVTGGSGGGVLTSWIVGKTNRFAAAVVAKPVINWFSFALTADSYNYFYKYWFPGYPWDHLDEYMRRSPIMQVGKIETPTMLLTGENDYRTPISESEQLYQALKLRKIPTAMVRIPGAGHGIAARPSHLISKTAYVLYWFEKFKKKK